MISKNDILSFEKTDYVLNSGDDFIYHLPHLELRNWISNYTITFPHKNMMTDDYTVIPHGSATLVFYCDSKGMHSDLFGPSMKPIAVGKKASQCDMIFIIEFQPAGLSVFIDMKQKELIDKIISFNEVNIELNNLIIEALYNSNSIMDLINIIDDILLINQNSICPLELKLSIKRIIENLGNISSKDLSEELFYSERQLNRIFNKYLGMNIKSFSRLVRVNKAIRLLNDPQNSITDICNLSGFYDLSHFIHDFSSICGITPHEYRNNMSDFYSEIAKFK